MTGGLDRTVGGRVAARPTPRTPGGLVEALLVLAVGTLGFRLGSGADPPAAVTPAVAVLVAGCPLAVLLAARLVPYAADLRAARLGVRLGPVELDLLSAAAAVTAAAAAAAGLVDPVSAAAVSAAGVVVVAAGALVVALCGGPSANRTRHASGVTPVTTPDGATCG